MTIRLTKPSTYYSEGSETLDCNISDDSILFIGLKTIKSLLIGSKYHCLTNIKIYKMVILFVISINLLAIVLSLKIPGTTDSLSKLVVHLLT